MPAIKDYLSSTRAAATTFINLDIDFSQESSENIVAFCIWLRQHPSLTRIDFRRSNAPVEALGTDLSRVPPLVLTQLFAAILDNSRIQTVTLPRCGIANISDRSALESVATCLENKEHVYLTEKRDLSWLGRETELDKYLIRIANGQSKTFAMHSLISADTRPSLIGSFLDELARPKEKRFDNLSLSHNKLGAECFDHIIPLLALHITSLDLSNNPIGQGVTVDDWRVFFEGIEANPDLKELSLKNCCLWGLRARSLDEDEETSMSMDASLNQSSSLLDDKIEFQNMLLSFVRRTCLTKLDLDLNGFDESFIMALREAAERNPNAMFVSKFMCGHSDEGYLECSLVARKIGTFATTKNVDDCMIGSVRKTSGSSEGSTDKEDIDSLDAQTKLIEKKQGSSFRK